MNMMADKKEQPEREEEFWICQKSSARKLGDDYILGDIIGRWVLLLTLSVW